VHRCLNGTAPRYTTDLTVSVGSTAPSSFALGVICRSCRTISYHLYTLVVPSTRRSTIDDRSFAVAGPRAWNSLPPALRSPSTSHNLSKTYEKAHRETQTHCALAVVRRSHKFSPCRRPLSGGAGQPKSNQLEMVTTFTYRPSLVKIYARNFELSW